MKTYAMNAKKTSLCTKENVKSALLGQKLKRTLTCLRTKLQNMLASILEFLFEAAGVEPGELMELSIVLVVSFLLMSACSWAILSLLAGLAALV